MSTLIGVPQSSPTDTLRGKVVTPEHGAWDTARLAWNLAVDQHPAAVVFPESAADVVAAVRLADLHGLRIAAQGTGHNAAPLGDLSDTLLVKTERMRGVKIDARARVARVQAGSLWLEVVEAAASHGLAALAGSSPDVGVVGYTLGGGMSWIGRKYGLSANNVVAVELVTADGRLVRADREHETDLFWALRGGGGNFGMVTAIEIDLFPIAEAYAGILWFPLDAAGEVLQAWRELTESEPPDELTTVGRFLSLPPLPDIPEELRGRSFAAVEAIHIGEPAEADELLAPLRELGPINDTIAMVPMPALSHLHMDPPGPVPGLGDGRLLADLSAEAVERLVAVAGAGSGSPLLSVEVRHLDGEFGRPRRENGALASIEARYAMYAVGITPVPEAKPPVAAHVEAIVGALAPWTARQDYLNLSEGERDPSCYWSAEAYTRLRRVKAAVDPRARIRANHAIEPLES